jgi:hypothetical protein
MAGRAIDGSLHVHHRLHAAHLSAGLPSTANAPALVVYQHAAWAGMLVDVAIGAFNESRPFLRSLAVRARAQPKAECQQHAPYRGCASRERHSHQPA